MITLTLKLFESPDSSPLKPVVGGIFCLGPVLPVLMCVLKAAVHRQKKNWPVRSLIPAVLDPN